MSSELLLPVGRMVGGSVYEPRKTDAEGNPLIIKNGPNAGHPRVDYYIGVAVAKTGEPHWNATAWGQVIQAAGQASFPQGQYQQPAFAWKVTDGDSQQPNTRGTAPASRTGYPGHWVLNMSSAFAPQLYNADGSQPLLEPGAIKCGYYVQVFGSVNGNNSQNQPGVFLNHNYIALSGYGEEIHQGPDPSAVGFGGQLPVGASQTPVGQMPTAVGTGSLPPPPSAMNMQSHARVMLPAANGIPYEAYIKQGWSDAQLIQAGMMQP